MAKLIIMIGIPGSGKDTIIKNSFNDTMVVSSDEIRKELFGFENQLDNQVVFNEMNKRTKQYLENGMDVIYNATNTSKKYRKNLITEMSKYGEVDALLCICSIETILARNLTRTERRLPYDKLIGYIRNIDIPLFYEGFKHIYIIRTDNYNYMPVLLYQQYLYSIEKEYSQDNPYHEESLLEHHNTTCKYIADNYPNDYLALRLIASLHDIGKIYTREYDDNKKYYRYFNHEKISAYIYLLISIEHSDEIVEISNDNLIGAALIYHHMDIYKSNLEKTKMLLGENIFNKLLILMEADKYRGESNEKIN